MGFPHVGRARIVLLVAACVASTVVPAGVAGASHRITELVSIGPAGGSADLPASSIAHDLQAIGGGSGISQDGSRITFGTSERLVPEDTDSRGDVYQRVNGAVRLLSIGPTGGNGIQDVFLAATSEDGRHVFFLTQERLVAADTDDRTDVYDSHDGQTSLITPGGGQSVFGRNWDRFRITDDGEHAFFDTPLSLLPQDTDNQEDVYERHAGSLSLVTPGTRQFAGLPYLVGPGQQNVSQDGSRVLIDTPESLDPADTDEQVDVYEFRDGHATFISTGPTDSPSGPRGAINFRGMSADGARVFFEAIQPLTADDSDAGKCFAGSSPCIDVYERAGGVTRLVSAGDSEPVGANAFFAGASPDGLHVFFRSDGAFTAEDREGPGDCYSNSCEDIFERFDGTTRLVTTGPADPHHAEQFAIGPIPELFGTTADGGTAFFKTFVRLVPGDTDHCTDIYSRHGGVTELVSAGPKTGCDSSDLVFGGASADGARVFFTSGQHLTADDTDSGCEYYDFDSDEGAFPVPCVDVFERQAGRTTLISKGPAGGSGPYRARFFGNSLDGTVVAFGTPEALVPEDRDNCINQPGYFGSGYIQGPGCDDVYLARTAPPDCSGVEADVTSLWPPNGKLRPVTITGAVDFAGQPLLARITGVTQDEAGAGDAAPGSAPNVVRLRAARSGAGNGRVYRIAFTATDDVGESCGGTVAVGVPHSGGAQAIDSAPPSFRSL